MDYIRYRWDWGGDTISNWTEYYPSNTTIFQTHQWNTPGNYSIKILGQDEKGMNSSWSEPLFIYCQKNHVVNPIVNFTNALINNSNSTIMFSANIGNISREDIQSYLWDFDDGTKATGSSLIHTYQTPGQYNVTLKITDTLGNSYQKTISLFVHPEDSSPLLSEESSSYSFINPFITLSIVILIFVLIGLYRNTIYLWLRHFKYIGKHHQPIINTAHSAISNFVETLEEDFVQPFLNKVENVVIPIPTHLSKLIEKNPITLETYPNADLIEEIQTNKIKDNKPVDITDVNLYQNHEEKISDIEHAVDALFENLSIEIDENNLTKYSLRKEPEKYSN
jgi:hypothetical protein